MSKQPLPLITYRIDAHYDPGMSMLGTVQAVGEKYAIIAAKHIGMIDEVGEVATYTATQIPFRP